jgi:hypothetical protein
MTYATKDLSVASGAPIECYAFEGDFGDFFYTSYHSAITVAGIDFTPLPITRSAVETNSLVDGGMTMDFTLPFNNLLAKRYAYTISPRELNVTVYRVHEGDDYATDYKIEWFGGGAVEFNTNGDWTTIKTGSKFQTALNGNLSAAYFQRLCNHVLFDDRCKVDADSFKATATVIKLQGQVITVDNDGFDNSALVGGQMTITRTGEKQAIILNTDNVLRIGMVPVDIVVGDTLDLFRGCNHFRLGDCKNVYNNVVNYGGFDFIPVKNPYLRFNKTTATSTTTTAKKEKVEAVKAASFGGASASYS